MPHLRRRFSAVLAVSTAIGSGALVGVPAAAAGAPTESVTVFLTSPDPAGLDALAGAHGLSHAQRVAALQGMVPSDATHRQVAAVLRRDGMQVTGETAWSITASGAQPSVESVFGIRPALPAHPSAAAVRAASGALPDVPASLRGVVIAAFPTTGGPAPFHAADATPLDGTDFRDAYTASGTAPPAAAAAGSGSTIATLQLADYDNSDLTTYAGMQTPALPNIVGTPKYHEVAVDGGPSTTDDQGGGDVEVDLDQESILSTATAASQRPYFAPNTDAGFDDVFANVFDDVVQNSHANSGGDPNIVALSSSWGECESAQGAASIKAAETVLKALTAAGVTVFASSGDDGIYDCGDSTMTGVGNTQPDVDYPASSPEVVGVGGTNLQHTGATSAPNDGSNWAETVWSCTDSVSCQSSVPPTIPVLPGGTGGGGGGESGSAYVKGTTDGFAGFAEPAYQKLTVADAPFTGQAKRMVPDIAADGDPDTGFNVYTSDAEYSGLAQTEGGYIQVGGTSLSSPASAALFTNALAAAGQHTGVGDIHGALYSAYADQAKAFRDVTTGTNGSAADKGSDPSVAAQAGYDTASGLGGVLWPTLTPYLLSTAAPSVASSFGITNVHSRSAPTKLTARWEATAGNDPIRAAGTTVRIRDLDRHTTVYTAPAAALSGVKHVIARPGDTYRLTVIASDISGHTSTPVKKRVEVPIDDTHFALHGGWTRHAKRHDIGGSSVSSNHRHAYAAVKAKGRKYQLVVATGPSRGRLGVYRHGKLLRTVDLYSRATGERVVTIFGSAGTSLATRGFHLKRLNHRNHASKGGSVALDALYASF
jgi:kumamolisin